MFASGREIVQLPRARLFALLLALAAALVPLGWTGRDQAPQASAELLALAAAGPQRTLDVIVRHAPGRDSAPIIARYGGEITRDLPIINGYAARLPAGAVAAVAAASGVVWVSPDTPVGTRTLEEGTFYLHGVVEEQDSDGPAAAAFILSQAEPADRPVPNFDADRDTAPGLRLARGAVGGMESDMRRIQRWRLPAFAQATTLQMKLEATLYAMPVTGVEDEGKLCLYLLDRGDDVARPFASRCVERDDWGDNGNWKKGQIKISAFNYTIPAGHQLEIALTVDGDSPHDMHLAFGTGDTPARLKFSSISVDEDPDRLYLHAHPDVADGDSPSQPLLPTSHTPAVRETLFNYDAERDSNPGLTLLVGGSALSTDPARVQRWALTEGTGGAMMDDQAKVRLYASGPDLVRTEATLCAALVARGESGARLIRSGCKEADWGGGDFDDKSIDLKPLPPTVESGERLELVVWVAEAEADRMWLAFDTEEAEARVELRLAERKDAHLLSTMGASETWALGYTGAGVRVAIVDSGIDGARDDFRSRESNHERLVGEVNINPDYSSANDKNGHGTLMASVLGAAGQESQGMYVGVAPEVDLFSVRVNDEFGRARESDVVAGLQWILDHKDEYNIRVANLSLNSATPAGYHQSPLNAAVEILWFNGVVVVVSAGNNGASQPGLLLPPANDPFVITVGATNSGNSPDPADDVVASFSAHGLTADGYSKPEVVAPGVNVAGMLGRDSFFEANYSDNALLVLGDDGNLHRKAFFASGTSVSAAATAGAVALLLEAVPDLTPDQVKHLLQASAQPLPGQAAAGAGVVDAHGLVQLALSYDDPAAIPSANTGLAASQLLWSGNEPVNWGSVNWGSVNWGSVNWGSVNWGSVNWGSINWGSTSVRLDY